MLQLTLWGFASEPSGDGKQTGKSTRSKRRQVKGGTTSRNSSNKSQKTEEDASGVIYARVSTRPQIKDLHRQVERLSTLYPGAEVIKEVAGGLNLRRKGLLSLLGRVLKGDVKLIVVAHKDRLARFGFDLIEWLCETHDCQVVVLNQDNLSPHQELVADIIAILHSFSSRLYSLRKHSLQIKELIQESTETQAQEGNSQQDSENPSLSGS